MSRSEQLVAPQSDVEAKIDAETVIETDSLVEEVSIDGMCGVY
ncbi:MAG: mycofactocin precursor MftA [Actinomycetota bacterium]|nr:mycofactocin precursor MftA [Actinomycetota bacterium]